MNVETSSNSTPEAHITTENNSFESPPLIMDEESCNNEDSDDSQDVTFNDEQSGINRHKTDISMYRTNN
jgi:hypothetical protein